MAEVMLSILLVPMGGYAPRPYKLVEGHYSVTIFRFKFLMHNRYQPMDFFDHKLSSYSTG